MNKKSAYANLGVYGAGHFFVDFVCAFVLAFTTMNKGLAYTGLFIILYNLLAFGLQPFIGFWFDRHKYPARAAVTGLFLVSLGLLMNHSMWPATVLLGVGNAFYHIGGGLVSLHLKPGSAIYPGIFVAPGTIGLFAGGGLGAVTPSVDWVIIVSLAVALILIFLTRGMDTPPMHEVKDKGVDLIPVILILLLTSIAMRALIGFSLVLPWTSQLSLGVMLALSIAAGKFCGGFVADRFGFVRTGLVGIAVAAPLLVFGQSVPLLVFIGAFCFNLVMPVTLTVLAQALPNYKGVAFGLTTLALVTGYLFDFLRPLIPIPEKIFTAIFLGVNFVTLYYGLKEHNKVIL